MRFQNTEAMTARSAGSTASRSTIEAIVSSRCSGRPAAAISARISIVIWASNWRSICRTTSAAVATREMT